MSGRANGRGRGTPRSAGVKANGAGVDHGPSNDPSSPAGLASSFHSEPVSPGPVIGRILAVSLEGTCAVAYQVGSDHFTACAATTVALTDQATKHPAVLAFVGGDPNRPIVIGLIQGNHVSKEPRESSGLRPLNVEVAGTRVVISADDEIVLRCGKSSVTLTRAGKVVIRGAYVLTRASGVNRIKGASVQIN
jgi:uncharacterized protein DUF6484